LAEEAAMSRVVIPLPPPTAPPASPAASLPDCGLRGRLVAGLLVSVLLVVGLGGWAASAKLSGAVIAPGLIVVDSNVKKVQHPHGGVVGRSSSGTAIASLPATLSA
jgi:HlyD family secretion protein